MGGVKTGAQKNRQNEEFFLFQGGGGGGGGGFGGVKSRGTNSWVSVGGVKRRDSQCFIKPTFKRVPSLQQHKTMSNPQH